MTSTQRLIPVWFVYVGTILIIGFANKLPVQDLMPRFWWEYIYRIVAIALCLWALRNTDFKLSDMWRIIGRRPIACIAAIILIFGLASLTKTALDFNTYLPGGRGWPADFYNSEPQRSIDLTLGLLLVALSEELIFRTLPLYLYSHWFRNGLFYWLVSAFLFSTVHMDSGAGSTILSFLIGIMLAVHYQRFRNLLWIFLFHYIFDVLTFSGLFAENMQYLFRNAQIPG